MYRMSSFSDFAEMVSRVERNPSVIGAFVYFSQDAFGMKEVRNPTTEVGVEDMYTMYTM